MTYLTLNDAYTARCAGQPWQIRIEFVGRNSANASGHSAKFWSASGQGKGPVQIKWGKIGGASSNLDKDWAYVADKLPKKLAEGYSYVAGTHSGTGTIYTNVSPAPLPVPVKLPPTKKPVGTPAPAQDPLDPSDLAASIFGAVETITKEHARLKGLAASPVAPQLPGPFGLIAGLRAVKQGFEALDVNGRKLLLLTFDGGRQLSQEHNVPVLGL
jgi:hypothetical protein